MSVDETPRLKLGQLVDGQELDAMAINEALVQIDAFTDICLKGQFVNTPPGSPADGNMYLLGGAPTGAWSGQSYKLAYCIDGGWRFYAPFDGLRAFAAGSNGFLVYRAGQWLDANALISANEVSIASAATCDLGAAASLFVAVTGTTTITSLGTGANLLRFVRFAGALSLTYNATSLVLPGGASIVTAAGDHAIFASDASGNWRCRNYARASGQPVASALAAASLALGGDTSGNILGASQSLNGIAAFSVLNGNGGSANQSAFRLGNGTSRTFLAHTGTGFAPSSVYRADATYLYGEGAGGVTVVSGAAQPVYFAVNNSEAGRFGSDGSLLVGTAANGGWQGSARFEVKGAASGNAISGWAPNNNAAAAVAHRVDYTGNYLSAFFFGASLVGSVTTNGSVTAYNTTSDARLKTVGVQADHRDAIRALWVGDFTWTGSGAPGFGVLAQQAYAVMPCHAGVTPPADETGTWQASSEPFAFLSLWGVKDLYALVEALAARVAALEARHAG